MVCYLIPSSIATVYPLLYSKYALDNNIKLVPAWNTVVEQRRQASIKTLKTHSLSVNYKYVLLVLIPSGVAYHSHGIKITDCKCKVQHGVLFDLMCEWPCLYLSTCIYISCSKPGKMLSERFSFFSVLFCWKYARYTTNQIFI